MKVEITEEEREFLQRVCIRAEIFCGMGINPPNHSRMQNDLEKIKSLIKKFRQKPDET
jgi:hypothetical protein